MACGSNHRFSLPMVRKGGGSLFKSNLVSLGSGCPAGVLGRSLGDADCSLVLSWGSPQRPWRSPESLEDSQASSGAVLEDPGHRWEAPGVFWRVPLGV